MPTREENGRRGRARGTRLELEVADALRLDGWVVGSMRTVPGGGDLMAARSYAPLDRMDGTLSEVRLVEVKGTSRPFERFGPAQRAAMLEEAHRAGASAWLAWRAKGARSITWIADPDWPR